MFFTRLTPNFNDWKQPSGRDGKCSNQINPLYEEKNGFGWEEWLFEQYHIHKSESEFICKGFVEAYNKGDVSKDKIDRLYLYTKVCENKLNEFSGCYYVGYIDNVTPIDYVTKLDETVKVALNNVSIVHNNYKSMLKAALNISFKVKDVHVCFGKIFKKPLDLNGCDFKYQFELFKLEDSPRFSAEISKYTNQ